MSGNATIPFDAELAGYVRSSSLDPGEFAMLMMLRDLYGNVADLDVSLDDLAERYTRLVAEINRVRPHLPEE